MRERHESEKRVSLHTNFCMFPCHFIVQLVQFFQSLLSGGYSDTLTHHIRATYLNRTVLILKTSYFSFVSIYFALGLSQSDLKLKKTSP